MSRPIVILTDSASDITAAEQQRLQVKRVPMSLVFDGKDAFLDDNTVSMPQLWERMEAGEVLTTSQPSIQTFLDLFEEAQRKELSVVCVCISAALSGTCQAARAAAGMVGYEHIHIVDARQAAATAAEKLLVHRACKLRDQGLSAGEIAGELTEFRSRIRLFACVDTLEYLVRGGRLGKLAGGVGTLLGVKPIITFSPEGTVTVAKKARGMRQAIAQLCELVVDDPVDRAFPIIPIFAKEDGNCKLFLQQLSGMLESPVNIRPQEIGPTIGCHIGPGGFGLAYVRAKQ